MVAVMNVVNFTDGVDGLAAGVCTISGVDVRDHRAVARSRRRGRPGGRHRGRRARVPLAQLPSRERLHGGCGLEPARADARVHRGAGRAENGRGRRPRLPARRAGGADPRHGVRGRQAVQVPAARLGGGRRALPPPDGADRVLATADRPLPVPVDPRAGRAGARAAVRAVLRRPRQLRHRLDRS